MDELTNTTLESFILYGKHVERLIVAITEEGGLTLSLSPDEERPAETSRILSAAGHIRRMVDEELRIPHDVKEPELPDLSDWRNLPEDVRLKHVGDIITAAVGEMNILGGVFFQYVREHWSSDIFDHAKRLEVQQTLITINALLSEINTDPVSDDADSSAHQHSVNLKNN